MSTTSATNASPIVSGTTPLSSSSSSSSSASATNAMASQQIAGNFQSFLELLTTQLQNQNPLDPLDTNQFTQQLVEFAGVQEQLNTNDSLSTLISLQQTEASSQALGYVGQNAVVAGSTTALSNDVAGWMMNIPSDCTLTVNIANSSGATVYTGSYSANAGNQQPFIWNGLGNDGTQYPAGNYTMTATAKDSSGNNVAVTTAVEGTVSSVDLTQSPPLLWINGQSYTLSQIQSIVAPASSSGSSGSSS
ncbi:MAG TPA: flagellar hook capping FlgD N-terminal domain-containing protein [Bradyrhizobium sp.]|nr:flagellar hook capping FlgD N-terminal domain-containing protein [Bradyrhizobium sp.]